jgi:hypothetical protein
MAPAARPTASIVDAPTTNGSVAPTRIPIRIDGFVISHRMTLEQAPSAYHMFCDKDRNCRKVVMTMH